MKNLIISPYDIALVGYNIPNKSLIDGDFEEKYKSWRAFEQSEYWTVQEYELICEKAGLAEGTISSGGNRNVTYKSDKLINEKNTGFKKGDVIKWSFASRAEYRCCGYVKICLCFSTQEICLCDFAKVPYAPQDYEVFSGEYTLEKDYSPDDAPCVTITMDSDHKINVYVDWIDIYLSNGENSKTWDVLAQPCENGIKISWNFEKPCNVYRSDSQRKDYKLIAKNALNSYIDTKIVDGRTYYYSVAFADSNSLSSYGVGVRKIDTSVTSVPKNLKAVGKKWTVDLTWDCSDEDVEYYNIFRKDIHSNGLKLIAPKVCKNSYKDNLPVKECDNEYAVQAVDFSGNASDISYTVSAKVTMKNGASFSDLIKPLPVTKTITSNVWGADYVLPRDADNGIEDDEWSYWCAKPVRENGKYHINVVRWREDDRKGHWAWPYSKIAYAVSNSPLGPYKIVRDLSYEYHNGEGHNSTIILMNDGTYLLYSLIEFVPTLFSSKSIAGPWHREGVMTVSYDKNKIPQRLAYTVERNLSGIQLEDGSMLFVTKNGRMIKSEKGILGPYYVLTEPVVDNKTVPEKYRKYVYEDPVMWRDDVQFHMIINAFVDFKAIYLRSPNGLDWYYEDGFAYTPLSTIYEDGTKTLWHKIERPSVLSDKFGRAEYLAMAVIDIEKEIDYPNDNHSSKSQILPLVVYKRTKLLSQIPVDENCEKIEVLIYDEEGFIPSEDLDLSSLIFGASDCVNYGIGAKVLTSYKSEKGLIVTFKGKDTGLKRRKKDFAGKIIAKTNSGDLVVAYIKLY